MKTTNEKTLSASTHDRRSAHRLLAKVAKDIGRPLPLGNGTNGPWQNMPVLSPSGFIGVLDIAHGIIILSNVRATRAILRITDGACSRSVHQAGGSGHVPAGWRRIVAYYTMDMSGEYHRSVTARATHVVWGIQTCYGEAGKMPHSEGEAWWSKDVPSPDEVPYSEIFETWQASGYYPSGVQMTDFFKSLGICAGQPGECAKGTFRMSAYSLGMGGYDMIPVRIAGGNMCRYEGGKEVDREVQLFAFGPRGLREKALASLDAKFQAWALQRLLDQAREIGEKLGICRGKHANGNWTDEETDRLKLIAALQSITTRFTGKVALSA